MQTDAPPASSKEDTQKPLSEDDIRVWNELWATAHSDHYACCYEEATAEFLVSRWRLLDTISKFLTALTASGSTVAAWTVWASQSGQMGWAMLSGTAALLALIHMSLGISDRIKEDTLIFSTFQQLRLDLEIFKKKIRLKHYETLTSYLNDYLEVAAKFGKAYALKRPDFFLTTKREIKIQNDVDRRMGFESRG
jgi:hypothetical protein